MSTNTTTVTDVRKYEQKIVFGQELPTFPEDYRLPDSYYLHLPKDTLFSLADYAAKLNYFDTKVLEKINKTIGRKIFQYNHGAEDKHEAVELYKNNAPDPQDLQDVYNEVARNYPGELDAI